MEKAVLLALAASFCTATASVCQRLGARITEDTRGFDFGILFHLVRQPIWLAGLASQILGFLLQVTALHFGDLALVQPILATELLFVFAAMSVIGSRRVRRRDWLAATAMAAGLGLFLLTASPSGGHLHARAVSWLVAGAVTAAVVLGITGAALGWEGRSEVSRSRRAALLGVATGIAWGFVAAVIKELSSHLGHGVTAILSNWSPYVLVGVGAATMLLASHALSAGPLAASQPGFTILDPLTASLLGLFLFDEHVRTGALTVVGELAALALLVGGVAVLSHSQLVVADAPVPDPAAAHPAAPPRPQGHDGDAGRSERR